MASAMRNGLLLLTGLAFLAGCGGGVPGFMGREGETGIYRIGGQEAPRPVQAIPVQSAVAERALHGAIIRVEGVAPTQGFYSAVLRPLDDGAPDAAGVVSFEFVASPPAAGAAVGPARTRTLTAAVFVPNLSLKTMRAARISAAGGVQTLPLPAAPETPGPL